MSDSYGPGRPAEPLFLVPWQVPAFAGAFVVIHAVLMIAPDAYRAWAYTELSLVPARFVTGDPARTMLAIANLATYGLLHYDWFHVLLNVALLMAGAGPVFRNCGAARLYLLFALSVIAGGVCHVLVYWGQPAAVIGASAGAAGVIAAAIRFRFRRLSQGEIVAPLRSPPVMTFTLFWVGLNAVLFLWDTIGGEAVSGYATIAHIGGYVTGLFLASLLVRGVGPRAWSPRH